MCQGDPCPSAGRLIKGRMMEDGQVGQSWRLLVEEPERHRGKAEHSSPLPPTPPVLHLCQCRGPRERPRLCSPSLPTSMCAHNAF